MQDALGIVIRVLVLYFYVLALLRISGKRSVWNISALDFVVTNILSDQFDNMFWGQVPITNAFTVIFVLIFLHILVSYASYRSSTMSKLVEFDKRLVINHGKLLQKNMAKERTPEEEVLSGLRMNSEDRLVEVKEAYWEPSGSLSVLKMDVDKNVQRQDIDRVRELFR